MSSNYALRNGAPSDSRYSKDQLLSFYKSQRDAGTLGKNVADYFVADWDPHGETPTVNGAWGQRDDKDAPSGPEICWDHGGHVEPLGLTDMTDDEKEVCDLLHARESMLRPVVFHRVCQLAPQAPAVERSEG